MRRAAAALLAATVLTGAAVPAPVTTSDGLVILQRVAPKYPAAALKRRIEGCVVVAFEVRADGRADNIEVLDSQPAGEFDQATFEALNEWRFASPPRQGRYAQSMRFKVNAPAEAKGQVVPPPRACVATPSFEQLNVRRRELRILSRVAPDYSRDAGAPEGGACVTLDFEIRPDGTVGAVTVLDAAPGGRYVQETIDAVKQWRFEAFEPPALHGQQTFTFDPELVRLPDDAVRAPYAAVGPGGTVQNLRCDASRYGKVKKG